MVVNQIKKMESSVVRSLTPVMTSFIVILFLIIIIVIGIVIAIIIAVPLKLAVGSTVKGTTTMCRKCVRSSSV